MILLVCRMTPEAIVTTRRNVSGPDIMDDLGHMPEISAPDRQYAVVQTAALLATSPVLRPLTCPPVSPRHRWPVPLAERPWPIPSRLSDGPHRPGFRHRARHRPIYLVCVVSHVPAIDCSTGWHRWPSQSVRAPAYTPDGMPPSHAERRRHNESFGVANSSPSGPSVRHRQPPAFRRIPVCSLLPETATEVASSADSPDGGCCWRPPPRWVGCCRRC